VLPTLTAPVIGTRLGLIISHHQGFAMTKKPPENSPTKPTDTTTPPAPATKKKLSLDVSNVTEILERKISP